MISFEIANAIIRQEAHRARKYRWDAAMEDRRQEGWVILLEHSPQDPALARTIVRRRMMNRARDDRSKKRGAGAAIGRLDAGWDEEVGVDETDVLLDEIATSQAVTALGFKPAPPGSSRQAQHQAVLRAVARWDRIKRPYD